MRRDLGLAAVLALLAPAAVAQGVRNSDVKMDAGEMRARISGKSVLFFDGSEARYFAGGAYSYRYTVDDPELGGTYRTTDDSQVCVRFVNGFGRCDTYVQSGDRLVLITRDGLRFPVRMLTDLE